MLKVSSEKWAMRKTVRSLDRMQQLTPGNGKRSKLKMEITGKITECVPVKSGQSSNGEWRKQEYVLQTDGQYPKKICFMAWGEKIEQFAIKEGETVQVSIDLESREYNGRWYTDVKAWKVARDGSGADGAYPETGQDDRFGSFESSDTLDNDVIPF